jgi:hypothetical protein
MNPEWHKTNAMPKNATTEQRIAWPKEHTQNCGCRPFPKGQLARLTQAQSPGIAQRRHENNELAISGRGLR